MSKEQPARLVETHVSVLTFVGDHVYKLKKPVSLEFVDLRAREARERACRREVDLNRRLAPDVYEGVLTVVDEHGHPLDHLVSMKRLPDERRLTSVLCSGEPMDPVLRQIVSVVVALHQRSPRTPAVLASAGAERVLAKWQSDVAELDDLGVGALGTGGLPEIARLSERYVTGRRELFARRASEGRGVDGHGDLLADDIFCLDDGARILDCLEFDDSLRFGDALSDVAFLAMDLERLGAKDLASRLAELYRAQTGDDAPASLLSHYVAYRALVRAKVALLTRDRDRAVADDRAKTLLELCLHRLRESEVTLVLVGGFPGTGKSTLSGDLARQLDWSHLRTDVVRKDLSGAFASRQGLSEADAVRRQDLYSAEMTERTYAELLSRARSELVMGRSVLLDATWSRANMRARARRLAAETSSRIHEIRCSVPVEVAVDRVTARRVRGDDPSDAGPAVARALAGSAEAWPEAKAIDTSVSSASARKEALTALRWWSAAGDE
jgi:uncharacterized protein